VCFGLGIQEPRQVLTRSVIALTYHRRAISLGYLQSAKTALVTSLERFRSPALRTSLIGIFLHDEPKRFLKLVKEPFGYAKKMRGGFQGEKMRSKRQNLTFEKVIKTFCMGANHPCRCSIAPRVHVRFSHAKSENKVSKRLHL